MSQWLRGFSVFSVPGLWAPWGQAWGAIQFWVPESGHRVWLEISRHLINVLMPGARHTWGNGGLEP